MEVFTQSPRSALYHMVISSVVILIALLLGCWVRSQKYTVLVAISAGIVS